MRGIITTQIITTQSRGKLKRLPALTARSVQPEARWLASSGQFVPPAEAEQAIARMASFITSAPSVHRAQRAQLAVLYQLLKPRACYVARYSQRHQELQVACVRGRSDDRIAAARPGDGPIGKAYSERQIIHADRMIAIPLMGANSVTGCLGILSPRRKATDHLLATLGAQLAAASEVARLREEMARRHKDLETALAGLRSLQKNRELMLSNVSHDLKNPLTPIKVYLSLLARESLGKITERQANALQVIDRNADRLMRMVSDLVLTSRLQSGKMTLHHRPFGLRAVADQVVRTLIPLSEGAGVSVSLSPGPEVFVRGDPDRIGDAIFNLVEHAVLVSGEKGEVEIGVSTRSGMAVVSVRDSGPGMLEEDQDRVFDALMAGAAAKPYYGSPRRLGLPIVAKIAQLHGGRAEVKSKLGQGCTFRVYLPVFAAAAVQELPRLSPTDGGILLVEDDQDCREVLCDMLEQHGYSVKSSSSPGQALSILRKTQPALVLLDWRLSDDDARSVLQFIRFTPRLTKIPVFVISGSSEIGCLSSEPGPDHVDGYFEKPLNLPKLMTAVASVVRPKSARDQ